MSWPNIDLYADDSILYTLSTDLKLIQSSLQYNLTDIHTWYTNASMTIHPDMIVSKSTVIGTFTTLPQKSKKVNVKKYYV